VATAWRDGSRRTDAIPVSSYQIDWDANRPVQGQASLVIADPDGDLWPRCIDDPLAPGGSRLQLEYIFGASGTRISLGWWRIRRSEPKTKWIWRSGHSESFVPGGGTVAIEADEETVSLAMDRLDVDQRQSSHLNVWDEIFALTAPYMTPIGNGFDNIPIPRNVEYSENRLAAIAMLLSRAGATYRMDATGKLELIPENGIPANWSIHPGENGTLVSVSSTMDDRDLANAVTAHRTWTDEYEAEHTLIGRSQLESGPLRFGGPFGRIRAFLGANLATTQNHVDQAAATSLARLTEMGDVVMTLDTLANPAVQIGDVLPIRMPRHGTTSSATGRVTKMTLTGVDGVAKKDMRLHLAIPHNQLFGDSTWQIPG
jgi:hypothetical protein